MKSPSEYANEVDLCGYDHDVWPTGVSWEAGNFCCAKTLRHIRDQVYSAQVAAFQTAIDLAKDPESKRAIAERLVELERAEKEGGK